VIGARGQRFVTQPPRRATDPAGAGWERLPPARERELVLATEAGDAAATEQLVDAFSPAIAGMARRYRGSAGVDRAELLQEGVVGLLRAAKRYDASMGTPFWAYASWWVRQAMQQLVSEVTRPVVLSDRALRRLARIKDARSEHLQAHGHDPTVVELAEATDSTLDQVDSLLAIERAPHGLGEPLPGEDGAAGTFEDVVVDPQAEAAYDRAVDRMTLDDVRALSDGLPERERDILNAHYGLGRAPETLRQIAEGLGLSVERVRQLEERALGELRAAAVYPSP
jgi:RNA polymerase sigma factor (sigma-70 family)